MRLTLTLFLLIIGGSAFSQMRTTFNQYMINPGLLNPGFMDIQSHFGGTLAYRKQYMSAGETPLTIAANGFYRFNHYQGVGMIVTNDKVAGINTLDVGFSYAHNVWLTRGLALGLGVKASYQQRTMENDYVYFSEMDPVLSSKLNTFGFGAGVGLSLQSEDFQFGLSLPNILNNGLGKKYAFAANDNHFYSNISYKCRFSDGFIFVPSAMVKGVSGSPISMAFDGHFLLGQLVWIGGGYHTDNTVGASAGLFLKKGVRVVYSYESAFFTAHTRFNNTHEITVSFATDLKDYPFGTRLYRKKNGKHRKNPDPSRRR